MVVYVTISSSDEAIKLARSLHDANLISCANIHETFSLYRWRGERVEEKEWVLVLKTRSCLKPSLTKHILDIHPYDCPCIVAWPFQVEHESFAQWMRDETLQDKGVIDE